MNNTETISAYIGLGSNLRSQKWGEPKDILEKSLDIIRRGGVESSMTTNISLGSISSCYHTEPQHVADQPFFCNQVVELRCTQHLSPFQLLDFLQKIESFFERTREGLRYGPRTLDMDILLFGDISIHSESLTIPHPLLYGRAFVLLPLAEIAPDLVLPSGLSVKQALEKISYRLENTTIFQ